MPRANPDFLAGCFGISHGCHEKQFLLKFFAIDAGIRIGFSKPGSEKLSQDSFGSYFSFPLNLAYFNNTRKIFSTSVLKALAHSSRY